MIVATQIVILTQQHRHLFRDLAQLRQYCRELNRMVDEAENDAAQRRFNLGFCLVQAKDQLPHGSMQHVYNDFGVRPRRAQMAMAFARAVADTTTGEIDPARLAAWEAEQNARKAETRRIRLAAGSPEQGKSATACAFEWDDEAELPAFAEESPEQGKSARGCAFGAVDVFDMLGVGDQPSAIRDQGSKTPSVGADTDTSPVGDGGGSKTGGGTPPAPRGRVVQMDLPWHLAEVGAKLPGLCAAVEDRVRSGLIDHDDARRIQARIDQLHSELEELAH